MNRKTPIIAYSDDNFEISLFIETEEDLSLVRSILARAAEKIEQAKTTDWLNKPLILSPATAPEKDTTP